jgi:tungstate transport system ATP-binding protein
MSSVPAYSIRSLIHAYDGKTVLDIQRLDIDSGRIWGLVGPNGSGKSTLLSILALLLKPLSGSVLLDGIETTQGRDLRQLRRKVTLIHQKPVLFSTTVANNLAYGLRAAGLPSKGIKARIQSALKELELSVAGGKAARKLSGGEAQRVILGRGLILETPILLLDEPTNSLDNDFRPLFQNLLLKANQKRGATIVIATHDLNFVSSLTQQIIRLENGKILPR